MTAFDHDVVVVGGGPAGASTALHLIREQRIRPERILVIDKATFPRDKPCGGAVSQLGIDVLDAIGVRPAVPSVEMRGVRVIADGASGETACEMGIVVRRTEFDHALLREVHADGVIVREGDPLVSITRIVGGFRLQTRSRAVTTRLVAACDGVGSTTRKLLSIPEAARKGHLYVLDTRVLPRDTSVRRSIVDFDLSPIDEGFGAYYWDFPTIIDGVPHVSRRIYDPNLVRPQAAKGRDVKSVLARALERRGVDIADVTLRPFSTRPLVRTSTLSTEGVVLVGEAAGIDRTTGEGITQAIVTGAMAARHIARALRTGSAAFHAYAHDVRGSVVGRHMLESAWFADRVYGSSGRAARRLLVGSTFAREAAVRWYRGEPLPWSTKIRLAAGLLSHGVSAFVR